MSIFSVHSPGCGTSSITLSTAFWSDDPESRPKSFLGLEARSEAESWDVLCKCCRTGLAPAEAVGISPG